MLLLGQEGLVSHLPGLICKKRKKKKSSFLLLFFVLFFILLGRRKQFYFRFEGGKMCRYVNKSLHVRYNTFGLSTIAREILRVWGRLALWEKWRRRLRTCQSIDTGCIGS